MRQFEPGLARLYHAKACEDLWPLGRKATPDLTLPPSRCRDSCGQTQQRPVGSLQGRHTQLEQKERVIQEAFVKGVTCGLWLKDEFG